MVATRTRPGTGPRWQPRPEYHTLPINHCTILYSKRDVAGSNQTRHRLLISSWDLNQLLYCLIFQVGAPLVWNTSVMWAIALHSHTNHIRQSLRILINCCTVCFFRCGHRRCGTRARCGRLLPDPAPALGCSPLILCPAPQTVPKGSTQATAAAAATE